MGAAVLATWCLTWLLASCVNDYYPDPDAENPGNTVGLSLQVQMLSGGTRAGGNTLPAEQIQHLRVVIVNLPEDSKGNPVAGESAFVEVNALLHTVLLDEQGRRILKFNKILADRKKKIYFLANCESDYLNLQDGTGAALSLNTDENTRYSNAYIPGTGGASPIDKATFTAPVGTYEEAYIGGDRTAQKITGYCIPITARHELSVPSIDELEAMAGPSPELSYTVPDPLYIVRAVNKFSIVFKYEDTERDPEFRFNVKDWTLGSICSGRSYLFASVDNDWKPAGSAFTPAAGNPNPGWMQWLNAEAEKTQGAGALPDSYEWFTAYTLPAGVGHAPYTYTLNSPYIGRKDEEIVPGDSKTVYFPETLYLPDAGDPRQRYTLACTFGIQEPDSTPRPDFNPGPKELPFLNSLFRNTHVKIEASLSGIPVTLSLWVGICPWIEETIDIPEFD